MTEGPTDLFDLERCVKAQGPVMEAVLSELKAGMKQTHWMWFVFPQLKSLGRSSTAQFYGIGSLAEANAYLRHDVLGSRLVQCSELVNAVAGRSAYEIFGTPDDLKFRSSVTLFNRADPANPVFPNALTKFYGGKADPETLRLLL